MGDKDDKSKKQRIRELEDREQIRQIFVEYAKYLDGGNFAGYASLFSEHGVLLAQLGEAVGPAAIEKTLEEALGPYIHSDRPASIHVMNNHRIDIDGDTATTDVIWFYLTVDPDTVPTILQAGRYVDELVRENGQWKIARHDISRIFGRSPMMPAPDTLARPADAPPATARGPGRHLAPVPDIQEPPRPAPVQGLRRVVHRRRGVDGQPRQVRRPGADRGHAREDAGGLRIGSAAGPPPRAQPGDRRRRRHGHSDEQLGVRHAQRDRRTGVRDARHVLRRTAAHRRRLEVLTACPVHSDIPYIDITDVKNAEAPYVDPQYVLD